MTKYIDWKERELAERTRDRLAEARRLTLRMRHDARELEHLIGGVVVGEALGQKWLDVEREQEEAAAAWRDLSGPGPETPESIAARAAWRADMERHEAAVGEMALGLRDAEVDFLTAHPACQGRLQGLFGPPAKLRKGEPPDPRHYEAAREQLGIGPPEPLPVYGDTAAEQYSPCYPPEGEQEGELSATDARLLRERLERDREEAAAAVADGRGAWLQPAAGDREEDRA